MLPGLIATMWRKSSRPAPDLVRRTPTSGFRTSSTRQRPTWTTPERQRPNSPCGLLPLCLLVPLLPAWQRRRAAKSGISTRVLPTGRQTGTEEEIMGRGILLYLLGVPIPIIILLALLRH